MNSLPVKEVEKGLPVIRCEEYTHLKTAGHRIMVVDVCNKYAHKDDSPILLSSKDEKLGFFHGVVVGVGQPYILQNGESRPLPHKVGDFVIYGDGSGIDFKVLIDGSLRKVRVVSVDSVIATDNTKEGELYQLA